MTAAMRPDGYSSTQIMLHWSIATLVVFQFFLNEGIGMAWRATARGEAISDELAGAANVHVTIGLVILALSAWRLFLRFTRGVPAPHANEPSLLRKLAMAAHHSLYALIVLTPLSGAATWFFVSELASVVHAVSRALLFIVALLHIVGGLVQHFVFRTDALTRILMTKD